MQAAVNEGDYMATFERWNELKRHAQRMIQTEPDFTKAANDLVARGTEYNKRAEVLRTIDGFSFSISGIVAGAGIAKAIVNSRVLTENDVVYGTDGMPIPDLSVVTIKRRRIRFRYQDMEFERPLSE